MEIRLGENYLTFTLNEKVSISSPEFVLILRNESTKAQYGCKLGADISLYTDRYNLFLVTVISSPTALNAELGLEHHGQHRYYVYEMEDADTFDFAGVNTLDLMTMTGEVEQGKVSYLKINPDLPHYINRQAAIISNDD